MECGPTIARGPMSVVEKPQGIGEEFERRRTDTLGLPINISAATCPMFRREDGEPFLQEAAIEIRVVGDDEHYPPQQIVDGAIVDAVTGDPHECNQLSRLAKSYSDRTRPLGAGKASQTQPAINSRCPCVAREAYIKPRYG